MQKGADQSVDYLSPQKRKRMKEYLSNSSISLANGQEKRYSGTDHFKSSNQMHLGTHVNQPVNEKELKLARDANIMQAR